jgi:hypothetical protein
LFRLRINQNVGGFNVFVNDAVAVKYI